MHFRVYSCTGLWAAFELPGVEDTEEFLTFISEHPDTWLKGEPLFTEKDLPYWIKMSSIQKVEEVR
jgi:hypothetical protein